MNRNAEEITESSDLYDCGWADNALSRNNMSCV